MKGPFTHFTSPGWQPADRSKTLNDDTRRSAGPVPGQEGPRPVPAATIRPALVYEARVRVNGELRRQTFAEAKTTAEAVQALDAFKTALRNGHPRLSRGGTASRWPTRTPSMSSGFSRTVALQTTLTNVSYRWRHLSDLHDRPLGSISRGEAADKIRALRKQGQAGLLRPLGLGARLGHLQPRHRARVRRDHRQPVRLWSRSCCPR